METIFMIYLDTHTAIWLHAQDIERFSKRAQKEIEKGETYLSPICLLELEYLYNIGRISHDAQETYHDLQTIIHLKISEQSFENVMHQATKEKWIRDLFDRIIVAQAKMDNALLLTKDRMILDHYEHAFW